jgi:peptide/nickel transport system substrate-binding protein
MMRVLLCLLLLAARPAWAEDLVIAMKGAVDSPDPHQSYTPNRMVELHVYEPLLVQDGDLHPQPGLAESWHTVDPLTWEFTLRPGVKFQDGSKLTPDDVAFSLMRAKAASGIRTYASAVRNIVSVEPTGERTFLIHDREPTPLQPQYLVSVAIVSARAAADATNADWNGGRAAIGTGPYRWVRWVPGQDVVVVKNPDYWGASEPWNKVTFRFITNDSARVAALLAGDVDVADTLPAELYDRVRTADKVKLIARDSIFTDYLYLDSLSPTIKNATDADGKPLAKNPLSDHLVRQAMDHALNRVALAQRAMQGGATPAGQIAPPGLIGHVDDLQPASYDPALSRKLLAQAGYPHGFSLNISCTNDRFAGDSTSCQAVGQMLDAVGIHVKIESLPSAVYFRRFATFDANGSSDFSATMSMYGSTSGLASEGMNTLIRTPDPTHGLGVQNRHFFSDPTLDAMLAKVDSTFDDTVREKLTEDAVGYAMAQQAVLPLFFVRASWGVRRELTLQPRADQYTLAMTVRRAE